MKLKLTGFLLCVIFFQFSSGQNFEKVIAEIGNHKITENDFKLRYELSPFVSDNSKFNQEIIKADFLLSMIAEYLWYLDALEKGLSNSENFKFYFKPLEDIFLRDYLFKEEVESKIKITSTDLAKAIEKSQFKLKSKIINSEDSTKILRVYELLQNNYSIDSIFKIPEFAFLPSRDFEIVLGSLKDEEVEDYLFTLNPHEFTSPIRSEIGWIIFYIKEKSFTPVDISNQQITDNIKNVIESRRRMIVAEKYLQSLLNNNTFDIDDTVFNKVFEIIYKTILQKTENNSDSIHASYLLNDRDYRNIKSELGNSFLQKALFKIENQNITVWDFLANLAFEEQKFKSKDRQKIYAQLVKHIKNFVVQQRLVYEAKKKNLNQNKQLKDELDKWKIHYLATQLKFTYLDSARISEREIIDYYNNEMKKDKRNFLLRLQILNFDNLEDVENTLNRISNGENFDEISKSYGKTDTLVNEMGVTELLPHFYFGELGLIASNLNLNEVYGPINRQGRYTLLKVLEKKELSDTIDVNFENAKNYIQNYLFQKKFNEKVIKRSIQLVDKYGVKIYDDVLKNIQTTSIPMFVHRFMGFGGKIAAVPLLDNWFKFINPSEFKAKVLP